MACKMKALEKMQDIAKLLLSRGIDGPDKAAELFVMQGLNVDLVDLYSNNPDIDDRQMRAIDTMVERRTRCEPLQYILGYTPFLELKLIVGKGVLIPRPETELMAEHAIKAISSQRPAISRGRFTILDLCAGSGCLALSLARAFPEAKVFGTDISHTALCFARRNAEINAIYSAEFVAGHLFEPFRNKSVFDFIIANPPYIRTKEIQTLQPEIRDWEPVNALDGGTDGLDFYRGIIPGARTFLADSGILMLELGAGCAHDVVNLFEDAGYTDIGTREDYGGIQRIVQATWIK